MFTPYFAWEPYIYYGQKKILNDNVTVYWQGEKGHGFYYLSSGSIKTTFVSEKGEQRVFDYVSPGMLFGEDGSNKNCYLGTAITTAPTTLYYFSDRTLLKVCKDFPEAAIKFINCQLFNFRQLTSLIQLLDSTVEKQMAYYLSQFAPNAIDIPINQTLLAKDLDTSRVTINKIIRKWKNRGLIEFSNQNIRILDEDRFKMT